MSTNNLVFFDKDGHYINFKHDDVSETYNGELIFDENSSDTFKTIGLYTFEKIPSFEFESNDLALQKFQLFNEYGFNITGNSYASQSVTNIESVNGDPNFYSKWIYGINFESKYPVGSEIVFDNPIYGFTSSLKSYTVTSTKKGAIMIISTQDNQTFLGLTPSSYTNITISGLNSIGINSYLDSSLVNNLSIWSEPTFYQYLYNNRKLNIINTQKNDSVITIKNKDINDKTYHQYYLNDTDLPNGSDLVIETILKTDLPIVYKGPINIYPDRIEFGVTASKLLKPGSQLVISGSVINTNYMSISSIPTFLGNTQLTYYATASQVLYNNLIYQAVQAYTQSATSSINPSSASYWTDNITYLYVDEQLISETLAYAEIYLTTNKLYYSVTASSTKDLTLAFVAEKYASDFDNLNIDLRYFNKTLRADLKYASEYANINFYHTKVGATYAIGLSKTYYENTIEIKETLISEFNKDISERYSYNVVFTDIDEYGIIVEINGLIYQQEVQWVYSGLNVDMIRTVDKTLRAWLSKYFLTLYRLGISCNLDYLVNYPYVYFDSITLKTIYPNIPLSFNILVGSTANFYIQHSNVIFYEIGNTLSIVINGKRYDINFDTNVSNTLSNWVDTYSSILDDYKIYTSQINNTLHFDIKEYNKIIDYTINIGKSILPGGNSFKINSRIRGNLGALITSNSAVLASTQSSFLDIDESGTENGFATGMITSINNTIYPFDNQEYNLLEVNPDKIVFSYQGPFWGGSSSIIFNGSTSSITIGPTSTGPGAYQQNEFDYSFDIIRGGGSSYTYSLTASISNMVDISYINTSEMLYVLGDGISVYDGLSGEYLDTISLSGLSQSLKLVYNNVSEHLFVLSSTILYKIDPSTNFIVSTYSVSYTPYDCIVNETNGDVYISYSDYTLLDAIDVSGTIYGITSSIGVTYGTYKMSYNQFEDDVYVTTGDNAVLRINGTTRVEQSSYSIDGLQHTMIYEPVNSSIYVMGSTLSQINNSVISTIDAVTSNAFSDIIFNNISQDISISRVSSYDNINLGNTLNFSLFTSTYGYLSINQYDERIYLSAQNSNVVEIINPSGTIDYTIGVSSSVAKLIYNPLRKSMWGILPGIDTVVEISVELTSVISIHPPAYNGVYDSQYGTLDKDYQPILGIWLKSRDYIRKPRENFEGEQGVKYVWTWLTDDVPDIFLYDFSGTQLPTTGSYVYTGEKPLSNINLNRYPNKDISKTASSAYQQTIFGEIVQDIDYINSDINLSYMPQPLEVFIGFNSQDEGVVSSTLLLSKRENVVATFSNTDINLNNIFFETKIATNGEVYGTILMATQSSDNFLYDSLGNSRGLKVGQIIQIFIKDNTNTKNKFISFNNGVKFKIIELYLRSMNVRFLNGSFSSEETTILNYPSSGKTTYLNTIFKVVDKEIGRFILTGQTEIEDVRYKTELTNAGKNITADDVFIFKTYDINEQGVDWGFLNRKRKEMLMVKDDIYPYVGSYKAIINAINYFGYNDLELFEYYRNININSVEFGHLYKVEIPDIFDNTVPGWKANDFIKHTMPNENYEDTNLFNLTYKITDIDGNNVLLYSLAEVLIKLQGLKYWLQRNVIPISHKILDITGKADFVAPNSIVHKSYDARGFHVKQSMSPFDFKVNEAYLMPVNSGSTVYNVVVDFYNESVDTVPDYFDIKIRTYKTYPEWFPFRTYNAGDIISYYQQIYESVIDDNRINDPRKYQNITPWNINFDYKPSNIAEYKKSFYEFIGTQSLITNGTSSIVSPFTDVLNSLGNWVDVTEWRKLDYVPVQTLNEFRTGTQSFHFTVDTNIDPFVTLEVTSDNGYGQIYTSKKNYELRGLLDITEEVTTLDEIGPIKIYNFLTTTTTAAPTTTSTTTTTTTAYIPTSTTTTTTTIGITYSAGIFLKVINTLDVTDWLCATGSGMYYTSDGTFATGRVIYTDMQQTIPLTGMVSGVCIESICSGNIFHIEPGSGLIGLPLGKACCGNVGCP